MRFWEQVEAKPSMFCWLEIGFLKAMLRLMRKPQGVDITRFVFRKVLPFALWRSDGRELRVSGGQLVKRHLYAQRQQDPPNCPRVQARFYLYFYFGLRQ